MHTKYILESSGDVQQCNVPAMLSCAGQYQQFGCFAYMCNWGQAGQGSVLFVENKWISKQQGRKPVRHVEQIAVKEKENNVLM